MAMVGTELCQKTALITGASSGIGKAAAVALTKAGYRVIGTSRSAKPDEVRDGIRLIACDVTSDESVAAAVALAHAELGQIDLLVNNAGFGIVGGAEESSLDQSRAIFETNFFGCIRMIKAVLPQMHQQGSGRIINMSSVLGRVPAPFSALYSATKHAIEGYSESLDHEIRKFNIRSILIEPAFTKTNFSQNDMAADDELPIYEQARKRVIAFSKNAMETQADSADVVARVIVQAAADQKPRVRYTAGSTAAKMMKMRRFVPERFFDSAVRKAFQLDKQ